MWNLFSFFEFFATEIHTFTNKRFLEYNYESVFNLISNKFYMF